MDGKIVFDATPSMRRLDENGFMHVKLTPISKACVNPYLGSEIPEWEEHGLKPDEVYYALRDPKELEKAAETFNGLPVLLDHHEESAEAPAKEYRIGSTGTDAVFEAPYLKNSLSIMDADAIELIESGEMKELSCCYMFDPEFTSGTFEGVPYDLVMRNIRGNHVALVHEGRAGHDVAVADSANTKVKEETMRKTAKDEAPAILLGDVLSAIKSLREGNITADDLIAQCQPNATDEEKVALTDALSEYAPQTTDEEPEEAAAVEQEEKPADEEVAVTPVGEPDVPADFNTGVKAGMELAHNAPANDEPELEVALPADSIEKIKKAAKDEALREVKAHMNALNKAAFDTRATLGNFNVTAFDSAASIYKKALEVEGYNTKGYKEEMYKPMWDVAVKGKAGAMPAFDSANYKDDREASDELKALLYK